MSEKKLPNSRPQLPASDVRKIVAAKAPGKTVALLGIRGYYRDSMGKPGANDRGIYDDAMFLVTPTQVVAFNANTDPSIFRKRIATLKPGVWTYETGFHGISRGNPYPALRQSGDVTVTRDDLNGEFTGQFAINIHRGGLKTTSSEGCQTIPPYQWREFIGGVYAALGVPAGEAGARKRAKITYVLETRAEAEKIMGRSL